MVDGKQIPIIVRISHTRCYILATTSRIESCDGNAHLAIKWLSWEGGKTNTGNLIVVRRKAHFAEALRLHIDDTYPQHR